MQHTHTQICNRSRRFFSHRGVQWSEPQPLPLGTDTSAPSPLHSTSSATTQTSPTLTQYTWGNLQIQTCKPSSTPLKPPCNRVKQFPGLRKSPGSRSSCCQQECFTVRGDSRHSTFPAGWRKAMAKDSPSFPQHTGAFPHGCFCFQLDL